MKSSEISETIIISFFSTAIARTVFHPIDTLKTRLQFGTTSAKSLFASSASRNAESALGRSLWKGLGVTLALSCPAGAVYLTSYDVLKSTLTKAYPTSNTFLLHSAAGAGAEGIASILFTPMDVLKQKLMTIKRDSSSWKTIVDLYQSHGIRAFYRGYLLTQLVFVPFSAAYFSVYEKSKSYYTQKAKLDTTAQFACSLFAAAIASTITNPLDVIKCRIQILTNVSTRQVIRDLYKEAGVKAFAKGLTARIIWAAPSMSLSVAIWEFGKDFISKTKV